MDTPDAIGQDVPAGDDPPTKVLPSLQQQAVDLAREHPDVFSSGTTETKPKPAKRPAGFGQSLADFIASAKERVSTVVDAVGKVEAAKVKTAIARGAVDAIDNTSNAIVGAGAFIAGRTGLGHLVSGADFDEWNKHDTADVNPLQFGQARKDKMFGKQQGGVYDFVEHATSFTIAMVAGNKAAGVAGLASGAARFLTSIGLQGLATAVSTDPRAARLSDMIENGPPALSNPLTRFLRSNGEDSEALARLKSGLEGAMTGAAIDGFIASLKPFFKGAAAGKALAADAGDAIPARTDPVKVVALKEGGYTLEHTLPEATPVNAPVTHEAPEAAKLPKGLAEIPPEATVTPPEAMKPAPFPALIFDSAADAESHAASLNEAIRIQSIPLGQIDDADIAALHAALDAIPEKDLSKTTLEDVLPKGLFNYNYFGGSDASNAVIETLAQRFLEPVVGLKNRAVDGLGVTGSELLAKAKVLIDRSDADSWLGQARSDADALPEIQARQYARKIVVKSMAGRVADLSRALDVNPSNAVAASNLKAATDQLLHLAIETSGVDSGAGRLLQSLKNMVPELKGALKDGTESAVKDGSEGAVKEASPEVVAEAKAAIEELKAARAEATSAGKSRTPKPAVKGVDTPENPPIMDPENVRLQAARKRAEAILKKANGDAYKPPENGQGPVQMSKLHQEGITYDQTLTDAAAQKADPIVATAADRAKAAANSKPPNPVLSMAQMFDQMEADLNRIAAGPKVRAKPEPTIVDDYIAAHNGAEPANVLAPPSGAGNVRAGDLPTHEVRPSNPLLDALTPDDWRQMARQIRLSEGNPALILDSMLGKVGQRAAENDPTKWDLFNSYRANAMLSGPKTLLVNAISNAAAAFEAPIEYFVGGAVKRNSAVRQMGADMLTGMWENARASWSVAAKAWKLGDSILDSRGIAADAGAAETLHAVNQGGSLGWLAKFQVPTRVLMATDEFFKNFNYRNNVRALSLRAAREDMAQMGPMSAKESGDFLAARLADDLASSTDVNGHALNPVALDFARDATFQTPLTGVAKTYQDAVNKHPWMRIITPFVRTPINLMRYAWQRTPVLGALAGDMAADIAAGGDRAAVAIGKQTMGAAIWGSAAMIALQGDMTGAGPTDPKLRKQWLDAGHQPYSVRLPGTDTWMSYRRIDQLGTPLGLVADIVEMSGEMHDEDTENAFGKYAAALSANLSSKTFMSSVADFFDAVHSGDPNKWNRLFQGQIGSLIPAGMRQVDPNQGYNEVRGYLDSIKSRIPGYSETLEPRRNILGEPVLKPPGYLNYTINPFTLAPGSRIDAVQDELVKLGHGLAMPRTKQDGIDLTDREQWKPTTGKNQSPYDRMLELMGDPPAGNESLRQSLTALVSSPEWAESSDEMRQLLAQARISASQQIAKQAMLAEYPALREALTAVSLKRATALGAGRPKSDSAPQFLTP